MLFILVNGERLRHNKTYKAINCKWCNDIQKIQYDENNLLV
jgi:hypothetical protein